MGPVPPGGPRSPVTLQDTVTAPKIPVRRWWAIAQHLCAPHAGRRRFMGPENPLPRENARLQDARPKTHDSHPCRHGWGACLEMREGMRPRARTRVERTLRRATPRREGFLSTCPCRADTGLPGRRGLHTPSDRVVRSSGMPTRSRDSFVSGRGRVAVSREVAKGTLLVYGAKDGCVGVHVFPR